MAARQKAANVCVALLRGINVGGNKRVPMAELRALCAELGWRDVETYIQSGNLVFAANGKAAALESALEQAIAAHFGFAVPALVRDGAAWRRGASACPFDHEAERAKFVHLGLAKSAIAPAAAKLLLPYCTAGERIVVKSGVLWADYANGVARSKLTPAVLDRVVGSTVTMRNWSTVQQITDLVQARAD